MPKKPNFWLRPGENDLASQNPRVAAEWDYAKNNDVTPDEVTASSSNSYWWVGETCGHSWNSKVYYRTKGGYHGCPFCNGEQVLKDFNDLLFKNLVLASEWHPRKNLLAANEVIYGSKTKFWWLGKTCGHEWKASISQRLKATTGNGCPVCCGKKVLAGFNDLASQRPDMVPYWDYEKNTLTPEQVVKTSSKLVHWKCTLGHAWEATVNFQAARKHPCGYCSGAWILDGFNDAATKHPHLICDWHPTKNGTSQLRDYTPGSGVRVWWRGDICGHEWDSSLLDRTIKKAGCPICNGQRFIQGINDLTITNPKLAAQWHPTKNGSLQPNQVMSGTNKKVWWMDSLGHEWEAIINSRHHNDSGCPVCSGRKILVNFNDLGTVDPVLSSEWHPTKNGKLTPQCVTKWSPKKAWWKCTKKGHEWQATVGSRSNGRNCPACLDYSSSEERALFDTVKLLHADAINGIHLKVKWGKAMSANVDIYIPSLKLVIEYDGWYWHKDKLKEDLQKSLALIAAGFTVIRVRDSPLPLLSYADSQLIQVTYDRKTDNLDSLLPALV